MEVLSRRRLAGLPLLAMLAVLAIAAPASGRLLTTAIGPDGDGTGPRRFFRRGHTVAVDVAGRVFVTAADTDNVFRIDPGGAITEILTSAECGAPTVFSGPEGVAVDGAGNAYVACNANDTVFRITPGGTVTPILGPGGDGAGNTLSTPDGVAVDAAGNVYVVGSESKNVFKVTPGGTVTEILDGLWPAPGDFPRRVAVDSTGNVFVTGPFNVVRLSPSSVLTTILDTTGDGAGNTMNGAYGIAVDGAGNAYVACGGSDNVFKVSPGGTISEIIDASGDGAGNHLDVAREVAVDASGTAYVTGQLSDNVFEITPGGVITEIADATGDGAGNTLDGPEGVAVGTTGTVYVAAALSDNVFGIASGTATEIIDENWDYLSNPLIDAVVALAPGGDLLAGGTGSDNAFRVTPAGTVTLLLHPRGDGTGNEVASPAGIAGDAAGNVFVSSRDNDLVFRVTPGGAVSVVLDHAGDGAGNVLSAPGDLAVDGAGNLFVAGTASNNVLRVSPGGAVTEVIDANGDLGGYTLADPRIALDAAGNLFVAGRTVNTVFRVTPGGTIALLMFAGDQDGNLLNRPSDLVADAAGRLFVGTDTFQGSENVFRIDPDGTITEVFDGVPGSPLGPGSIAVDGRGYLYVNDLFGDRVFQGTPAGTVTPLLDFAALSDTGRLVADAEGNLFVGTFAGVVRLGRACAALPASGCRQTTQVFKGRLGIRDGTVEKKDSFKWTWTRGAETTLAALGNPLTTDAYTLCLYDESGTPSLIFEASAPPGGTCGSKPCWKASGSSGFSYADKDATPDGLQKLTLRSGADGKAKIVAKGARGNVRLPAMPLGLPLRLQLQASNGECWESQYTPGGVIRNTSSEFAAKDG